MFVSATEGLYTLHNHHFATSSMWNNFFRSHSSNITTWRLAKMQANFCWGVSHENIVFTYLLNSWQTLGEDASQSPDLCDVWCPPGLVFALTKPFDWFAPAPGYLRKKHDLIGCCLRLIFHQTQRRQTEARNQNAVRPPMALHPIYSEWAVFPLKHSTRTWVLYRSMVIQLLKQTQRPSFHSM